MFSIGQVAASATAEPLCTLPDGACLLTLTSDPASASTAYVGVTPATGALTAGGGSPLAPGQSVTTATYETSRGASLSVVCATGTAAVGFILSSYND